MTTHLSTTQCCSHTFSANDIRGRLMNQQEALGTNQHNLYGGNAERFAHTECPDCGTRYVMWLKRQAPNFRVLTISQVEESNDEQQTTKKRGRQTSNA